MSFHAIVPAGGAGSRLWPLSRKNAPKFLADLTGAGRSLLQQTVDRLEELTPQISVVTGAAHARAVAAQVPQASVIVEPSARGTMGAIGLAAAIIAERDPEAVVGSFAADHLIRDDEAFRDAVRAAVETAGHGYLVTIGIATEAPSTAYGYIETGGRLGVARAVTAFVEKPDEQTAAEYLATGRYLWNAGMFVAKASILMDVLERFHPEIAGPLRSLAAAWDGDGRQEAVEAYWEPLAPAVIDTAVAEPLAAIGGVAVVPADMGWSDIGDYASLAAVIPEEARAAQVVPGASPQPVVEVDSPGALVYANRKPIVAVGIPGVVVVDTDDVLLVTTREESQRVKAAVDALGTAGLADLA